jgi:RNA polymerase sigma-70 factor (ECF subfamily)
MPHERDPALEALLVRAATGDKQAAGELVCAFDSRLRRVIRVRLDQRITRRVGVDDVLQETHLEAVRRLPAFLAERSVPLLIWLRFLAVQRCITLARRHLMASARDAKREVRALASYDSASAALEQALSAGITTPSGAAARSELERGVREAVQSLQPLDREILCLRHFEELDNGEAASALGIESGTASKRYIRALVRLREVLGAARLDVAYL